MARFVPCSPVPMNELRSCVAVRQADKNPNSYKCNCPNRNCSICASIALKMPKDSTKTKQKQKNKPFLFKYVKCQPGHLPLQPHQCCICLLLLRMSFVGSNSVWQGGFCICKLKVHVVNRALLLQGQTQLVGAFSH